MGPGDEKYLVPNVVINQYYYPINKENVVGAERTEPVGRYTRGLVVYGAFFHH